MSGIDKGQFRGDAVALVNNQAHKTTEQFDAQQRSPLDVCARATHRTKCQYSPWCCTVAPELRALEQERRRAERSWLASGLTVHRQLVNSVKRSVNQLVNKAKTTNVYSSKAAACESRQELFRVTNNLMGEVKGILLPSVDSSHKFAHVFSDNVLRKVKDNRDNINRRACSAPSAHSKL